MSDDTNDKKTMTAKEALAELGEMILKSPAFKQYVERRAAQGGVLKPAGKTVTIPHEEVFEKIPGKKGEVVRVERVMFRFFRVELMEATDSADGQITKIRSVVINGKSQRPDSIGDTPTPTWRMPRDVKWDTAKPGDKIEIDVVFDEDGWWSCKLEGKTLP